MRSLIIGYGVTGRSFERFLLDKNQEFDIFDQKFSPNVEPVSYTHLTLPTILLV